MGDLFDVDKPAPQPAVPQQRSAAETTREAIDAQIEALPKILEAQRQYAPEFSETQLEQLRTYAPEFAKTALEIQRQISPEITAASDELSRYLQGSDEEEFNRLKPQLVEDVRSAQAQRGLGLISPLGSVQESAQIEQLRQNLKNRRLNIALSVAGRQPVSGIPTTSGVGQVVQNIDPNSIFARQNTIDAVRAQIFGNQQTAATTQRGQNFDLMGSVVGGGAKIGAALITCWVASEIFGGWMHPKTVNARYYVNNLAPSWFREFYIKYGERIAEYIKGKPVIKAILRPMFELFSWIGGKHGNK